MTQVWADETPGSGTQLDKIEHADGAHVTAWTNRDAKIEYRDFTKDGLPKTTIVTHFKNGSGLSGSPIAFDSFTQSHDYNGHGELTDYSRRGRDGRSRRSRSRPAMGNLKTLQRDGATLVGGDYVAAGRPHTRTLTLPSGKTLVRTYSYKQDTGQLEDLEVKVTGGSTSTVIAGSKVDYNGSLQVAKVTLHGISGGARETRYSYDARSRLYGSITATTSPTAPPTTIAGGMPTTAGRGVAEELLDPADFRKGQDRTPALDATTRTVLQQAHIDTTLLDPPSQTATPRAGHKIDTFARAGSTPQPFDYAGKAERVDDGQFHYHYDEKGRLDWVAEVPTTTATPIRRIAYAYDGNNRLVGRTAQFATPTTITAPIPYDTFSWATENRSQVINADGLPAETTFIWDPVTDRLIAVLRTGDSANTSDPYHNVLKQVIHGDMGYDDPLEVTSIDQSVPVAPGTPPPLVRLYPVYDEAAGGTLQAVVNSDGLVVARSSNNDPFGSEEFDLGGAAIDKVSIEATKTSSGAIDSVKVTMRATEQLAASTVATGARLAVVDSNGAVLRTATAPPTLPPGDEFTVAWTLSASDWAVLTDPSPVGGRTPVSLSIAATNTLRAAIWSFDLPILPAPPWATASQPVFSSSATPVKIRTSLSNVANFVSGIANGATATTTPYDVPNLSMVAVTGGSAQIENLLAATFQAQPFAEPFTRKFYVRERWYDPLTGTWLTPDPLGYQDSSNLYAFAGGDPVNGRDPSGMGAAEVAAAQYVTDLMNKGYTYDYALAQLRYTGFKYDERLLAVYMTGKMGGPVATRIEGGARALGGCSQVALGTAAVVAPEPTTVTKIIGGALIVRGVDNCQAGVRQMVSGKPTNTVLGSVVQHNLQKVMEPESAAELDAWLEFALDTTLTVGASASPKTTPQGVTGAQISEASALVRAEATARDLGSDVVVQGSRASGTAKMTSDIDFAIRVDKAKFDQLIQERFKTPNPGSAKFRTMQHAIDTGKIQAGEAGLSSLRKQLETILNKEVDISIVRKGGPFDNGATMPVKK